jgi:hypothetical protein
VRRFVATALLFAQAIALGHLLAAEHSLSADGWREGGRDECVAVEGWRAACPHENEGEGETCPVRLARALAGVAVVAALQLPAPMRWLAPPMEEVPRARDVLSVAPKGSPPRGLQGPTWCS